MDHVLPGSGKDGQRRSAKGSIRTAGPDALQTVDYSVVVNLWGSGLDYIDHQRLNNAVLFKSWRSGRARLSAKHTALVSTTACLQLTSAQLADTQAECMQVRSQLQDTSAQLTVVQADRDDVRSLLQQLQAAQEEQVVEEVFEELIDKLFPQEDAIPTMQDAPMLAPAPCAQPQQQLTPTVLVLCDTPADDAHAASASDQQEYVSTKQQKGWEPQAAHGDLQEELSTWECAWEPLLQMPMQLVKEPQQLQIASYSSSCFQRPGVQLLVQHLVLLQAHRQLSGQYASLRAGFGCLMRQLRATLADKQAAETQLQLKAAAAELVASLQKRCSDMAAALQDERSTSLYRAEQIQLLQDRVAELQQLVPEVPMDDVMVAGNLAAVQYMFLS